jgi:hypothetical protein
VNAVAYLKAALPQNDPADPIQLDADSSPILRPLSGDLLVSYVEDRGNHLALLNGAQLRRMAITVDDLHARAVANLSALAEGRVTLRQTGAINALFLDGNFEASLLLLDEFWDGALAGYYSTPPVVAVPARDVIAFSEVGSSSGIAELRRVVDRVWPNGDHLLSKSLFVRRNCRWSPFDE